MASIEKRSDSTYRITVSCGYSAGGKKLVKKKTVSIEPNLTEKQREKKLNEMAVLFEREVKNGTYLDGEKINFAEFAQKWLDDYAEKQLAPGTLKNYKMRLDERIIPAIGHIKLAKLQPHHLLEFYNNLAETGIRLDGKYTPNTKLLTLMSSVAPSTLAGYIGISPKTCIAISKGGNAKYDTAKKIGEYYKLDINKLFNTANIDGKLSGKTIKHHHDLISAILGVAVEWNIITSNPALRVKKPKTAKTEARYYDERQLEALVKCLNDAPIKYKAAILLAIDTGLRLSELAGLHWQDIDFDTNMLSVTRQRQYVSGYGTIEKAPKTENGIRKLSLTDIVCGVLAAYRKEQYKNRLEMGELWHDSPNIFVHEDGQPMHPSRPYKWLTELIEKKGLPKITFHQLRHTNASLLIAAGLDVVTLSGRLGHADKNISLNTYSHIIKSKEREIPTHMKKYYGVLEDNPRVLEK